MSKTESVLLFVIKKLFICEHITSSTTLDKAGRSEKLHSTNVTELDNGVTAIRVSVCKLQYRQ